jgi:bacteriocin biosynthesis cyclodehydratase domain-containing protein
MTAVGYGPSKHWTVRSESGLLILSAGADELYAIEDVPPDTAAELTAAWEREWVDRESLSPAATELFDQLVAAGIARAELPDEQPWKVTVRQVGDPLHELESALSAALETSAALEPAKLERSDFAVFVRTNGQLLGLYDGTPEWRHRPHLLLDAAYHHTISLGPLVFPGETACLACLAGRIGQYWGDAPPPQRPAVLGHTTLVASLVALELEKIAAGDYGLVNATISWDLRRWEIERNAVYKLPWCPFCGEPDAAEALGSIDLPWSRAA